MSLIKKAWGQKEHIHDDGTVCVDLLHISMGGYCSKHYHRLLNNKLYLLEGTLQLTVFDRNDPEKVLDTFVLSPSYKELIIPAGMLHQFKNIGNCKCVVVETAYISQWHEESDIERLTVGGVA